MEFKKLLLSFLIVILGIFAISSTIYAADLSANIDVTADKTEVAAGDDVTFTLKIKDIANAADNQITAVGGIITYDTNFFETITESSIEPSASADIRTDTGAFAYICKANSGTTTTIGTIKLKVKSSATGSGNVTFSNLESSDGESSASSENKTISISIKTASNDSSTNGSGSSTDSSSSSTNGSGSSTDSSGSSTDSSSSSTNGSGSSTNGSSSSTKEKSDSDDSSTKKTNAKSNSKSMKLPYTGTSSILYGILFVVIIISVVSFIKFYKHKGI